MKTVPFNYETFKASVDAGKPIQLCTSHVEQPPLEISQPHIFVANSAPRIAGVLKHGNDVDVVEVWDARGFYGNKKNSIWNLQMLLPDELEKPEPTLLEFAEWVGLSNTRMEFIPSIRRAIDIFLKEREAK